MVINVHNAMRKTKKASKRQQRSPYQESQAYCNLKENSPYSKPQYASVLAQKPTL
jgi:hypothetical protein